MCKFNCTVRTTASWLQQLPQLNLCMWWLFGNWNRILPLLELSVPPFSPRILHLILFNMGRISEGLWIYLFIDIKPPVKMNETPVTWTFKAGNRHRCVGQILHFPMSILLVSYLKRKVIFNQKMSPPTFMPLCMYSRHILWCMILQT